MLSPSNMPCLDLQSSERTSGHCYSRCRAVRRRERWALQNYGVRNFLSTKCPCDLFQRVKLPGDAGGGCPDLLCESAESLVPNREHGIPVVRRWQNRAMTVSNRSLERGLAVLECFRPGIGTLTHGEVSERTGLPKPTVTRLLGTLRAQGYLEFDEQLRAHRLGVAVLSLSRCLTLSSGLHAAMAPAIRRIAQATRTIIGFGTAHDTDIVYLEAFNGDPARSSRHVGAGMRAPIATTSVGHGYMAGLSAAERGRLVNRLAAAGHPKTRVQQVIESSAREVRVHGFCVVPYADGKQAAIGAPVRIPHASLHAIGMGYEVPRGCTPEDVPTKIVEALHELVGLATS